MLTLAEIAPPQLLRENTITQFVKSLGRQNQLLHNLVTAGQQDLEPQRLLSRRPFIHHAFAQCCPVLTSRTIGDFMKNNQPTWAIYNSSQA